MCISSGFNNVTPIFNRNNFMKGIVSQCMMPILKRRWHAKRANGFVFNVFLHIGIQIPFSFCAFIPRTRCIHVAYFLYHICCLRFHLRATNMDNLGKYDSFLLSAQCASKLSECKRLTYLGSSSSMKTPSK